MVYVASENVMTRPSDPPVARIGMGEEEGLDGGVNDASWSWQTSAVWPCRRARHSLLCNYELRVERRKERYTPSSSIPYTNGRVQSSGSDSHTIKSDAVYLVEMPLEDMDAFTRIHVPYLCTKPHHQHQLDSGKSTIWTRRKRSSWERALGKSSIQARKRAPGTKAQLYSKKESNSAGMK